MTTQALTDEHFRSRRLPLAGTFNVRDIGGYPAAAGLVTRPRMLLRGDALHRLDPAGAQVLIALGLRTIVDLRERLEREASPDLLEALDVRAVHVPLHEWEARGVAGRPDDLGAIYADLIDERGSAIVAAIHPLADPDGLPGLVHCTGGKDRTGVVIALLLSVLGVPDEIVAADFAATSLFLAGEARATLLAHIVASGGDPVVAEALLGSDPQLMMALLAKLTASYGGAEPYLLDQGLTPEELARLRSALLVEVPTDDPAGSSHG